VLVQLVAPQEHPGEQHRRLRQQVEQQVNQINGAYGRLGYPAVHYQHRRLEPADLVALYLAADVLLATPLRDGMNLTAKEYVAARTDHTGAVVLSGFTATIADFPQAFTANPHDIDALRRTIHQAARADPADLQPRMSAMRRHVLTHHVRHWAGRFLIALGQCATTPPGSRAGDRLLGQDSALPYSAGQGKLVPIHANARPRRCRSDLARREVWSANGPSPKGGGPVMAVLPFRQQIPSAVRSAS
jgi:trehalose-6-phosphate synthase